jgi:hypothetical protein
MNFKTILTSLLLIPSASTYSAENLLFSSFSFQIFLNPKSKVDSTTFSRYKATTMELKFFLNVFSGNENNILKSAAIAWKMPNHKISRDVIRAFIISTLYENPSYEPADVISAALDNQNDLARVSSILIKNKSRKKWLIPIAIAVPVIPITIAAIKLRTKFMQTIQELKTQTKSSENKLNKNNENVETKKQQATMQAQATEQTEQAKLQTAVKIDALKLEIEHVFRQADKILESMQLKMTRLESRLKTVFNNQEIIKKSFNEARENPLFAAANFLFADNGPSRSRNRNNPQTSTRGHSRTEQNCFSSEPVEQKSLQEELEEYRNK